MRTDWFRSGAVPKAAAARPWPNPKIIPTNRFHHEGSGEVELSVFPVPLYLGGEIMLLL
jgi:hypothetical protein